MRRSFASASSTVRPRDSSRSATRRLDSVGPSSATVSTRKRCANARVTCGHTQRKSAPTSTRPSWRAGVSTYQSTPICAPRCHVPSAACCSGSQRDQIQCVVPPSPTARKTVLTTKDRMASGNVTRRKSTARHPVPSPIPLHSVLQKPRRRVYGAGGGDVDPEQGPRERPVHRAPAAPADHDPPRDDEAQDGHDHRDEEDHGEQPVGEREGRQQEREREVPVLAPRAPRERCAREADPLAVVHVPRVGLRARERARDPGRGGHGGRRGVRRRGGRRRHRGGVRRRHGRLGRAGRGLARGHDARLVRGHGSHGASLGARVRRRQGGVRRTRVGTTPVPAVSAAGT